jgi:uncharacterized protein (DUF1778 family)
MPSRHAEAKETRISVRIKPAQKAMIERAARLRHTTLTDFVVDHALHLASQLVGDETQMLMTAAQFKRFCRALDAPPPSNLRAMRMLLNEPTILDG